MEAQLGALGFATPDYYPPQATVSLAETTFMPSPEPSVMGETEEKKPTKKRKSWGQELPTPKTNLPPRKRAKTEDEKEQRRIERVLRNRQAAQSSRERKRQEVEKLEGEKYSIEEQNQRLKERLMTVEHEKFQLAQQVAKMSAEMSRYRNGGSLAPVSTATSCAPSPSLHPDMFHNIKQELDDYPFALPTPQHSIHLGSSLTPPSTCSIYSRSPSPFHGGFNVCTSSSDMTQHPAVSVRSSASSIDSTYESRRNSETKTTPTSLRNINTNVLDDADFSRLFASPASPSADLHFFADGLANTDQDNTTSGNDFNFDSLVDLDACQPHDNPADSIEHYLAQHAATNGFPHQTAATSSALQPCLGAAS